MISDIIEADYNYIPSTQKDVVFTACRGYNSKLHKATSDRFRMCDAYSN